MAPTVLPGVTHQGRRKKLSCFADRWVFEMVIDDAIGMSFTIIVCQSACPLVMLSVNGDRIRVKG